MKLPALLWFIMGIALLVLPWLTPPRIEVEWITGSEYNTIGFNVYRGVQADGPFIQLNDQLIPAEGDTMSGRQYQFVDQDVIAGQTYYYILEDMEFSGRLERHDPIIGRAADIRLWCWPLALLSALLGSTLLYIGEKRNRIAVGR